MIVIVGVGGVGSWAVRFFREADKETQLLLIDPDTVERKNLRYANFLTKDIGKSKAKVLADRYQAGALETGIWNANDFEALQRSEVFSATEDLFILAVDSIAPRKLLQVATSQFIDVRAENRTILLMTHLATSEYRAAFVSNADQTTRGGCQTTPELHFGNIVAAARVAELMQDWAKGRLVAKDAFEVI